MNSLTTTLFPSATFYIDFQDGRLSLPLRPRAGKKLRLLALCAGKGRRCARPTVSHVSSKKAGCVLLTDGLAVSQQSRRDPSPGRHNALGFI